MDSIIFDGARYGYVHNGTVYGPYSCVEDARAAYREFLRDLR